MKLVLKKPTAVAPAKSAYNFEPSTQGISQSQIQTRLDCEEKARLAIVHGWTPKGDSKPLTWGSCFHGMLETGYRNLRAKKPWGSASALTTSSASLMVAEHPTATTAMRDLIEECLGEGQQMIQPYRDRWAKQDDGVEFVKVEDAFKVEHGKGPARFFQKGKFDAVYKDKKGRYGLLETKTKSQVSSNILDLLPLDLQLAYYITALVNDGITPTFVRYNIIRRPGLRRGKDQSLKDYLSRIKEDVEARPDFYFLRYDVELEPSEIKTAAERVRLHGEKFMQWYWPVKNDPTKRLLTFNSGHCENKYGACSMLPICSKNDYTNHYVREFVSPELKELGK
jgi:hypothetical protein